MRSNTSRQDNCTQHEYVCYQPKPMQDSQEDYLVKNESISSLNKIGDVKVTQL